MTFILTRQRLAVLQEVSPAPITVKALAEVLRQQPQDMDHKLRSLRLEGLVSRIKDPTSAYRANHTTKIPYLYSITSKGTEALRVAAAGSKISQELSPGKKSIDDLEFAPYDACWSAPQKVKLPKLVFSCSMELDILCPPKTPRKTTV
jgi:DNA-binding MarR family transcriptional regulator